ncbi:MAG: endonuclease domain-containing protein, partial [Acidobacteria bacterium]|nr:endonuclease domain-containing protein [Acidobacteriota bacterium]
MVEVARVFRKEPTHSEDILWQALRNRQLDGRKFRRQQPVGAFVLDFFCAEERLAVEVDGPIHDNQREADQMRQELIESLGIRFVRLTAETVEHNLPAALSAIRAAFLPAPAAERPTDDASLPSLAGERATDDASLPSPLVGEGPGVRGHGIDSLTGKTILQGYLGDYQKGEPEVAWKEFHFRLYQNRGRLGVPLSGVEGEIEREYAASLDALLPVKQQLARTDALIDKIVYRLYGLTDEEIELIERPQFEQGLADAKAAVIADKEVQDEETAVEKIAQNILPTAQRFFDRVLPQADMARLDAELPNWRDLPPEAPI